ncbi:conserved Plasmodium protein, unknown function [Plasmodium relictum]|uniref:Uncharacterized protein n=1 Tax=Plasmodium relictum TaxID=85471 RepID=A0A1J1HCN2_PLARL|nr:conserved Plasmodium protein, unknown function [Plasmodium relictum]CRH01180.1 conserved Plasmodium protein, unknown function [Plasmodium relictum]
MIIKKFILLNFFLLVVFLYKHLKSDFFVCKCFESSVKIIEEKRNDYVLDDAIHTILMHAPEENGVFIHNSINKIMSKRYINFNVRKILIRISSLIKSRKLDYLCDPSQLIIIIGVPQIISNAELLEDIKLYKLKKLIENIVNSIVICKPKNHEKMFYLELSGCQSQSDQEIIFDNGKYEKKGNLQLKPRNKFFSILLNCSVDNLGSGDKTMKCVNKELAKKNSKISESCSKCFENSVNCGKSNCWLSCLFSNPCSDSCFNCGVNYCKKELINCTGLLNLPDACV